MLLIMNEYAIYCTEVQTKKALELGAPIEAQEYCPIGGLDNDWFAKGRYCFHIPTAEEMIGWLEKQGVNCFILRDMYDDDAYNIQINEKLITTGHPQYNYPIPYDSRKEATLAAIDAALEFLSNKKE